MDVARSAGCAFSVRLSVSAGPSNARRDNGSPRAESASAKTAAAAGEAAASALPIPTDCEPWPGNTRAEEDIEKTLAPDSGLTRAGVCAIARKTGLAGILAAVIALHARQP